MNFICTSCKKLRDESEFRTRVDRRKSEHRVVRISSCKYCKSERDRRRNLIEDRFGTKSARIWLWKRNARIRNLVWEIEDSFFEKDKFTCFYTGLELTFIKGNFNTISLDRLDSSEGYTADNVVFCCWPINKMKGSLSIEQFLSLCSTIAMNKNHIVSKLNDMEGK